MPYVRKGKTVYKKVDGLKKKGKSKSVKKAKAYKRTLDAIHHGFKPTGKKAQPKGSAWKGGKKRR